MTAISDLKPGKIATVQSVRALDPSFRQKLLSMGLVPGVEVKVIRRAPFGDPIQLEVRDYCLCLRAREAKMIDVVIDEKV